MALNRREFLHCLAGFGASLVLGPGAAFAAGSQHTRVIPASGERLPVIGLGSWLTFGIDVNDSAALAAREAILREFLQRGGGLLDSSPMYGAAQEVIGRSLQRIETHTGLFAATKVWVRGYRNGIQQMERSRLLWGVPRFDLMQVHNLLDWETHLPLLQSLQAEGKLRYIGVTTSHGRRHEELMRIMQTQKLDFVQFTYNMLDREAEQYLLPMAADKGLAVIINRPFQRGGLFQHVAHQPLPAWAAEIECRHWSQFFLKYVVSHPAVTCAIPATSQLAHLQENMAAAYGPMPDAAMRQKMRAYIRSL
ncbi:MAG: aldo/keto reductase [Gammaproteobacteria bacterium]